MGGADRKGASHAYALHPLDCYLYINFWFQSFDRGLCCRQLRYSGMMETAKIRKAGYPIRYTYKEFIDQFRCLVKNIPPSHKTDCKEASQKICNTIFTKGEDYQFGHTKVFLKDTESEFLDQERSRILSKYVLTIQKAIKGWIYRRRFLKLRQAAIVVQKYWRARGYRSRYLLMKCGFQRLQARIRSKEDTYRFNKMRTALRAFIPQCKGYYARNYSQVGKIYSIVRLRNKEEVELKKAGDKNYKKTAEVNMQKRLGELDREYTLKEKQREEENNKANELVDDVFEFLKDSGVPLSPHDINESKAFVVRSFTYYFLLTLCIFFY